MLKNKLVLNGHMIEIHDNHDECIVRIYGTLNIEVDPFSVYDIKIDEYSTMHLPNGSTALVI